MLYNFNGFFSRSHRRNSATAESVSRTMAMNQHDDFNKKNKKSRTHSAEADPINSEVPFLKQKSVRNRDKKTLVLDLDETLVHCKYDYDVNADFSFHYKYGPATYKVHVLKRPGVGKFLKKMSKLYEIVIFTASVSQYCDPIIEKLDPNGNISAILNRGHCSTHHGKYVKDLSRLGRDLRDVVIIDNLATGFQKQPDNGILIHDFIDDPEDDELLKLIPFLNICAKMKDVRPVGLRYNKFLRNERFSYMDIEGTEKHSNSTPPKRKETIEETDEEINLDKRPKRFPDKLRVHEKRDEDTKIYLSKVKSSEFISNSPAESNNLKTNTSRVQSSDNLSQFYTSFRSYQSSLFSKYATNVTKKFTSLLSCEETNLNQKSDLDSDTEEGAKNSIELNMFLLQSMDPLPGSKKKVKLSISAKG